MKPKIVIISMVFCLLTACASNPDKIDAAYVSLLKYRDFDCDQIAMEMDYVGQRTTKPNPLKDGDGKPRVLASSEKPRKIPRRAPRSPSC